MAEKENNLKDQGLKQKVDPVFFISAVGVDKWGKVEEDEYIFDVYTRLYDFLGSDVRVITAQDLWHFYKSKNKGADRMKVDIYTLIEFFVQHHMEGHFTLDESQFLWLRGNK